MKERNERASRIDLADASLAALTEALASPDGVRRQAARERLQSLGRAAVPALVAALGSADENTRWEAAKALGDIADPRAAAALVRTLDDSQSAVRWLAATALINLGRDALVPLLQGLEGSSDSTWFREGAHHVLHTLVRESLADEAMPVLAALENLEPRVEAPVAAYHVLEELYANGGRGR